VVKREEFYDYWTERFSLNEISELAEAIWG
jgi:hypothetical protein